MNRVSSFGDRLRAERESRGIRLSAIADATKISKNSLEALESNQFGSLPGGVISRGFVRAYAEYVGLDAKALVAEFEEESRIITAPIDISGFADADAADSEPPAAGPSSLRPPILMAGVLLAVGAVIAAVWLLRPDASSNSAQAPEMSGSTSPRASALPPPARQEQESATSPGDEAPAPEEVAAPNRSQAGRPSGEPGSTQGREESVDEQQDPVQDPVQLATAPEPNPPGVADPVDRPEPPLADSKPGSDEAAQRQPVREEETSPAEIQPASGPGQAAPADELPELSVPDHGVGANVVDHQLQERRSTFATGERVWFWTKVTGGTPGQVIRHVWIHEGKMISTVDITLGGPHWRAHSWQTMYPSSVGAWTVEVRDERDRVLARSTFVCRAPAEEPVQAS